MPKWNPKSIDFQTFSKNMKSMKSSPRCGGSMILQVLGAQKIIKNRFKRHIKSIPEKAVQKVWKLMQKWSPNGGQDQLKI